MTARDSGNEKRSPPGFHVARFFVLGLFRKSLNGLSERETTRTLSLTMTGAVFKEPTTCVVPYLSSDLVT